MDYLLICGVAFASSLLTLFSGFGLGTLLLAALLLFFPVSIAVGLTGVVHLLNNLFKLALLGRHADRGIVFRFGAPAVVASFAGAFVLVWLSVRENALTYMVAGRALHVTPAKVVVGLLMMVFASLELFPNASALSFQRKYVPLGGILSGFFGGLSGHQGALRSAFLARCGLTAQSFVATGVVIACLVDFARIAVYGAHYTAAETAPHGPLVAAATLSAFLGAFLGSRWLGRVTMGSIRRLVSVMLFAVAIALVAGFV